MGTGLSQKGGINLSSRQSLCGQWRPARLKGDPSLLRWRQALRESWMTWQDLFEEPPGTAVKPCQGYSTPCNSSPLIIWAAEGQPDGDGEVVPCGNTPPPRQRVQWLVSCTKTFDIQPFTNNCLFYFILFYSILFYSILFELCIVPVLQIGHESPLANPVGSWKSVEKRLDRYSSLHTVKNHRTEKISLL
jgi:hypothetical protein